MAIAKIGLYEIWLIKGVGLLTVAFLNGDINSNHTKQEKTSVIEIASKTKPSKRGEFEISSVNQCYIDTKDLKIEILGRGFTWLDTGTHDSLLEASNFIKTVEKHSGFKVACLEEIAYKMNFINLKKLKNLVLPFGNSNYGKYLKSLIDENPKNFY